MEDTDEREVMTEDDALESFREYLGDVYGTVTICGIAFDSSRAFERLDPIAFELYFSAYVDAMEWKVEGYTD